MPSPDKKMPERDPAFVITASVVRTNFDATGYCKLTLEIPSVDAARAAALALHTQTTFAVAFWPEGPLSTKGVI